MFYSVLTSAYDQKKNKNHVNLEGSFNEYVRSSRSYPSDIHGIL